MTDQLQPNVLTVAPDGTIGADFAGTVNAASLILPVQDFGSGVTPVEWVKSNGAVVAHLQAFSDVHDFNVLSVSADSTTPGGQCEVQINANSDLGPDGQAALVVTQTARGADGSVFAFAPVAGGAKTITGFGGVSHFLQLLSAQKLQLQVGQVTGQPIAANTTTAVNVSVTAWPTNHVVFAVVGTHYSASLTGVATVQSGAYDAVTGNPALNHGSVTFANGPTAQNVTFWWISLGN